MQGFFKNFPILKNLAFKTKFLYQTLNENLRLTDICIKKIEEKTMNNTNKFLRLIVESGEGCAGFKYTFKFDEAIDDETDVVFEKNGRKIFVVDDLTLKLVKGCEIDYQMEMIRSGFQVVQNPNADKSCSCKTSFSPKPDLLS